MESGFAQGKLLLGRVVVQEVGEVGVAEAVFQDAVGILYRVGHFGLAEGSFIGVGGRTWRLGACGSMFCWTIVGRNRW